MQSMNESTVSTSGEMSKPRKKRKIIAHLIVIFLSGIFGYLVIFKEQASNKPAVAEKEPLTPAQTQVEPCNWYMYDMSETGKSSPFKTEKRIIDQCDNETFVELNYEYAKDKNFVYYRPMPNAYVLTMRIEGADPETFELFERCPGLARDKSHVFQMGKIVEGKIPSNEYDPNNPKTYCY